MWLKDFVIKHSIIKNSNDDNLWTLLSKSQKELLGKKVKDLKLFMRNTKKIRRLL